MKMKMRFVIVYRNPTSKEIIWPERVAGNEAIVATCRIFNGKHFGKRSLEIPRSRGVDVKVDARGLGCEDDIISHHFQWLTFELVVMNILIPSV
jgi:hypothetical protein